MCRTSWHAPNILQSDWSFLGFDKIALRPGETKTVSFMLSVRELAWFHPEQKAWLIEPGQHTVFVGASSKNGELLKETFMIL